MKNEIRTLDVHPAPDRDMDTARVKAIEPTQLAETLKSIARRAAVASSRTVGCESTFGCVDWFRYPPAQPAASTVSTSAKALRRSSSPG